MNSQQAEWPLIKSSGERQRIQGCGDGGRVEERDGGIEEERARERESKREREREKLN